MNHGSIQKKKSGDRWSGAKEVEVTSCFRSQCESWETITVPPPDADVEMKLSEVFVVPVECQPDSEGSAIIDYCYLYQVALFQA